MNEYMFTNRINANEQRIRLHFLVDVERYTRRVVFDYNDAIALCVLYAITISLFISFRLFVSFYVVGLNFREIKKKKFNFLVAE